VSRPHRKIIAEYHRQCPHQAIDWTIEPQSAAAAASAKAAGTARHLWADAPHA
jgi:hypothetical protein